MPDLSTTYLGISLKNPLVASASPLTRRVDTVRQLEDAGVSAVVMHSLFEEQIRYESHEVDFFLEHGAESYAEAQRYLVEPPGFRIGPEEYLKQIGKLKEAVDIPVIASLNGSSRGGWVDYAKKMQQAGADAIELNLYDMHVDPLETSQQIEQDYVDLVADVRAQVTIPLAVKLGPFFTSLPNLAARLVKAGADGLVLFNRFYQPDLDIETLSVVPNLELSTSADLRLPLRWVAIFYGRLEADLALSSGIHTPADLVKAVMAGAKVGMTTSALLRNGIDHARVLLQGLEEWMGTYEYESVAQMTGAMSQRNVEDPAAFERANYMRTLASFEHPRI